MSTAAPQTVNGASELAMLSAAGVSDLPEARPAAVTSSSDLVELKYRDPANLAAGKLANGLAMFSIGLGLAEALAPGAMARLIGVDEDQRNNIRALGLREIGHGAAILMSQKPTAAVWSRVAGDAIDLAYLAAAAKSERSSKMRLTLAAGAVLGVTALDILCGKTLSSQDWTRDKLNPAAPTNVGQPSGRKAA
ncbi:MAG: cyclase dehydrase [Pyrinomonadaceae bacterium]